MPSTSDIAVSVRGLSKSYTIAHQGERHVTLAESLLAKARRPFARVAKETFWALKNVEFDIKKGDVVGIIGRNGAGKSTLLKILSRITEPTAGTIDLYGRVGSLLEVGTGFHPELTGRENVFLNGAILGMTRAEIRKQFDAIVDFAGVEQFIDTPVKRYSSGMYVRLAFAVAAHLESEILIIDEVLAVGDAEFQKKCLGKMKDVSSLGRTVLFVSHNLSTMNSMCDSGLLLVSGEVVAAGNFQSVAVGYSRLRSVGSDSWPDPSTRQGTGEMRFAEFRPVYEDFDPASEKSFQWSVERRGSHEVAERCFVSIHVNDEQDVCVAQCDSRLNGVWLTNGPTARGLMHLRTPWLRPGEYSVDIGISGPHGLVDRVGSACKLVVNSNMPYRHTVPANSTAFTPVLSNFQWSIEAS